MNVNNYWRNKCNYNASSAKCVCLFFCFCFFVVVVVVVLFLFPRITALKMSADVYNSLVFFVFLLKLMVLSSKVPLQTE